MLGHFVAGSGYDEARCGGYVESVFAVASRTYHVYVAGAVELCVYAALQYAVPEAEQLVYGDASHLECCEQGCYLLIGILAACYARSMSLVSSRVSSSWFSMRFKMSFIVIAVIFKLFVIVVCRQTPSAAACQGVIPLRLTVAAVGWDGSRTDAL